MTPPNGRDRTARVLRGGVVATVATGVALGSHVAGGGAVPGLFGVLAPWVASLWVGTLLGGRPARWRTIVSVAAGQVAFHTLFVLGTPTGTTAGGHAHGAHHALTAPSTATATTPDLLAADPTMWVWHAAAAAATAALLFHGEAVLHRLRRLAGSLAGWLLPRPAPAPTVAPRRVRTVLVLAPTPRASRDPRLAPLRRRGPPLATV